MRVRLACSMIAVLVAAGCGGGGAGGAGETRRTLVLPHLLETTGSIGRVAAGDVNGDGVLDLVLFNADTSSVDVRLSTTVRESPTLASTGKGRLARGAQAYEGGQHTFVWDTMADLGLADMDADGALDLVVAGGAAAQVGVWRCDPLDRREFLAPVLLDTGAHADRIAVGDLDADGDLDLVCLDETTGQLKLFLQTSSSPLSFVVGNDPPAVGACRGLVLSDLDRDGDLDCLTNGYERDVLVVFEQDAAGVLAPRDVATGQSSGRAMGVGDVDGDGWLDVVVVSEDGRALACLHQRPAEPGLFDPVSSPLGIAVNEEGIQVAQIAIEEEGVQHHLRESPTRASCGATRMTVNQPGIGLADLDRDGRLDVVISPSAADPDGDLVIVYGIRESPSRFGPGTERAKGIILGTSTGGTGGRSACLADLDQDGHTDLMIGDPDFDLLRLLYVEDPNVPPPLDVQETLRESPSKASTGLTAVDLDRDGLLDVVTSTTGGLELRFQDPASPGRFLAPTTLAGAQSFVSVAAGDVNGDGCPDLVTSTTTTPVVFLRNPLVPRGFLAPIPFPPPAQGGDFRSLALADLDCDGNLDCVAIRESPSKASLGRGMGNGFFDVFTELDVGVSSPTNVAVGDLNGDGRPDLAVCGDGPDGSAVVFQDPLLPFTWTAPEALRMQGGVRVSSGDVNGDGRLDVVTTGAGGCVVALQSPDVRGRFLPAYALSSVACGGLSLLDLDRDGLLDVCFVETPTGTLRCSTGDPDFDLLRIVSLNGLPPGVPVEGMFVVTGIFSDGSRSDIVTVCPSDPVALDGRLLMFGGSP